MAQTARPAWLVRATRVRSISGVLCFAFFSTSHAAPYKSARGKFTITPPAGWTKNTSRFMGSEVYFAAKPVKGFAANIVAIVDQAPRGATIDQAPAQATPMIMKTLNAAKIEKQGFTKLAGVRAYDLTVTHQAGTPPRRLRARIVMAIRGDNIVTLSSTAVDATFKNYAPAFNKALASVRWTK